MFLLPRSSYRRQGKEREVEVSVGSGVALEALDDVYTSLEVLFNLLLALSFRELFNLLEHTVQQRLEIPDPVLGTTVHLGHVFLHKGLI